ncbi:tagatose-6-phosphate kinase [Lactobacillus rhamnosus]|uniref:Tagatose-6-phosphate kinase n=1 Tax=Lacticaseibacillus rhamnosus TaxID=47715 RepID=A0A7Y7QE88_LACRH|nr:tagatose-6-phosphate kinase [Lacticaseibacillus rhamnosus]NVO87487.1 tagatose-6-phosphate kinase [Lacticaseibacillus rhamnosus]
MILTVTLNPSIDVSYPLDHLKIDTVNRVKTVRKTAGGKGLNVSRVIHLLDHDITATGFIGGYFGKWLENQLDHDGIAHNFFPIDAETRSSIAVLHDGGKQTEILEAGPTIAPEDASAFLDHFDKLLDHNHTDLLTISGSMPQGLPEDYYTQMIAHAGAKNVKVLLDTSGATLKSALEAPVKPLLIKPNEEELAGLLNRPVDKTDYATLKQALTDPIFDGVDWIVVSLGSAGAFVKHQDKFYHAAIPKIQVVNPVGSGDSTLAGLAMGIHDGKSDEDIMKTAMTTGMLNTMEAETGFVNPAKFAEYFAKVTIETY